VLKEQLLLCKQNVSQQLILAEGKADCTVPLGEGKRKI